MNGERERERERERKRKRQSKAKGKFKLEAKAELSFSSCAFKTQQSQLKLHQTKGTNNSTNKRTRMKVLRPNQ